jgi:hypothetical protein
MIVDRRFRGAYCLHNPEDSSEHHTRRRENLKFHNYKFIDNELLKSFYATNSFCFSFHNMFRSDMTTDLLTTYCHHNYPPHDAYI